LVIGVFALLRTCFLFKTEQKPTNPDKNREKPVETRLLLLTKPRKRRKVNGGGFFSDPHKHRASSCGCEAPARWNAERKDLAATNRALFGSSNTESGGNKNMATSLTKTALVRHLAEKLELTNKQSAAFLDLLAETAIKETKKNGVFVIPGLGRLVKAERKARMGRNPQTGEQIKIKAKTVVKFRVAKAAKDVIAPPKK
jgi:DNA-binding protein HU-beta